MFWLKLKFMSKTKSANVCINLCLLFLLPTVSQLIFQYTVGILQHRENLNLDSTATTTASCHLQFLNLRAQMLQMPSKNAVPLT